MTTAREAPPTHPTVVHVAEALGGVEVYLRLLVTHWPLHQQFTFVLGEESPLADFLRKSGCLVEVLPMPRTTTRSGELRAVLRLRRVLRRINPDIVHLHSSQAGFIGRLASVNAPWRVVYTPHAFHYLGATGLARRVYCLAERVLDRIKPSLLVATSPSEARRAVDQVGIPHHRVVTCLNGVEVPEAMPIRRGTRNPRIGMVARIAHQKNIPMFLATVGRVMKQHPEARFCLLGLGHYQDDQDEFARAVREAGLPDDAVTVSTWKPHPEAMTWLESVDILILTSRYESFGYAVAEASARGIPVVATDVDGLCDVVAHNVSGLLVRSDDTVGFASSVCRLMAEPDTYDRLSAGGRLIAKSRLEISRTVLQLWHQYALLAPPPPNPAEVNGHGTTGRASPSGPARD